MRRPQRIEMSQTLLLYVPRQCADEIINISYPGACRVGKMRDFLLKK